MLEIYFGLLGVAVIPIRVAVENIRKLSLATSP
jgi:hypothetical protein